jgi:hypothetical protein
MRILKQRLKPDADFEILKQTLKNRQAAKTTDSRIANSDERINALAERVENLATNMQAIFASIPDIKDGKDGRDGRDGVDGKDGRDGYIPSKAELLEALSPMVDETKTAFNKRIKDIESLISDIPLSDIKDRLSDIEQLVANLPKPTNTTVINNQVVETDLPKNLDDLEKFIRKTVPEIKVKSIFGGGGPGYLFELLDMPKKSKGLNGAYFDYKNKYLKVSSDGKRLEWATVSGGGSADSFETVSKNLDASNATLNFTGDNLTSIVYANGITKTLNYTGDNLTSVVLSGSTPSGIDLTKTLTYTGDTLTGVTYL